MKGERGGTYWISPSGEKTYDAPGDGGGGGSESTTPDAPAHSAESSRLWSDSSTSNGLNPQQSKAIHADLQSIANEKSPDRQASGVKSFAAKIAMLPIQVAKSIIESLVDFAGKMLRSGARIVGAVGINLAGIAAAGAAVAAATLLPGVVPSAVALALALPIGVAIKKMLGVTSRLASRQMRGNNTPGVIYAEQFAETRANVAMMARSVWDAIDFERFAEGATKGPYKGERGATYWLTSSGERTYDPPNAPGKSDTGGSSTEKSSTSRNTHKAESLLDRIADVPGDVVEGVSNFVGKTYDRLEKRYGGVGAKLVMGGMIALAPVPIPGTSLIPIALAEGVRRIGGLLGLRKNADDPRDAVDPSEFADVWEGFAAEWAAYTNPKNGRRGAKSSGGRVAYGPEADRYLAGKSGKTDSAATQPLQVQRDKPGAKPSSVPHPDRAPSNPAPGKVYEMPLDDLHVDPARFQFKQDVKGPSGTGEELKGVTKFNPDFAGVVSVWKDPADGRTYVINGHHRHELAKRTGHPSLSVRYIDAPDAMAARGKGALINIAEGRGTAVDAAKFMRDTGTTTEDFSKHGVSLKGNVARDASVLMGLSDPLFSRVARGTLDTGRAMAIAAHLPDKDKQIELLNHVEREEQRTKKEYTPKVIAEAATEMAHTPTVTTSTNSLFGPEVNERSLFMQRNELKSHVRGELTREARDFKVVASQRRADAIAGDGNTLNVKANQAKAHQAEDLADTFSRLASYKGPLSDILNEQAEKYASASTDRGRDAIRSDTFRRIREALSKAQ